jgi:hypothetical protein
MDQFLEMFTVVNEQALVFQIAFPATCPVFQLVSNPTPSPKIHILLPSGVEGIGIDPWVERFTILFSQVAGNK